jgi:dihydroorotate dehydrogenase (fumarate)
VITSISIIHSFIIGKDAFDLILCGAKAVQVATCHWIEGPSCFERISNELKLIMIEKGYSCIEDFRGKLKPYQKPTKKEHDVKGVSTNDDDDNNNNDVDDRGKVSLESNTIIIYTLMSIIVILLAIIGVLSSKLNEYY